jgi:hypothetical protein
MFHHNWLRWVGRQEVRQLLHREKRWKQRFEARLEELESRSAPASFAVSAQLEITHLDNQSDTPGRAHAVVFFESSVADYQVLRQGLDAGTDAVVLDSGGDGVREMAAFLIGQHGLATVGVVAHGVARPVELGITTLSEPNVESYANELAVVGSALGRSGELDLWSCATGAGLVGVSLVQHLALAIGAKVAAADHPVGATALGGDWQLDVQTAGAGAHVPFSAAALTAFHEALGTWIPAASMATGRAGQTATLLQRFWLLGAGLYPAPNCTTP